MPPKELEQHNQNDLCIEKFKRVDEYMSSGKIFRDDVIKHSHQILTLEKISMDLKESIDKVDRKVDDLGESLNEIALNIGKLTASIPDKTLIENLDARLKSLELWRWFLLGGFAVILFIIEKLWK